MAVAGFVLCTGAAAEEQSAPDPAALEASGARISAIRLDKQDVFDLSDEREDNWLYRLANRLHIVTKDHVVEKQLLLAVGEPYSQRLADESARILRSKKYFYDARIEPVQREDGTLELKVFTKDVWTLKPGVSFSRSGGENKVGFDIRELNFLGYGMEFFASRTDDVDRESTSFGYRDPQVGDTRIATSLQLADNSDGHSYSAAAIRPFYALDTRWAAGLRGFDDDRRTAFYSSGDEAAEYQHERSSFTAFGGWSKGLQNGWVRRYRAGFTYDDNNFSAVDNGTLPAVIPADRTLAYPFLEIEVIEDQFETARNKNQIGRTEDFFLGHRLTASLGYSAEDFGADRDALIYSATYSRAFGSLEDTALLTNAWARGRLENGDTKNATTGLLARLFVQQSRNSSFFASIEGVAGHDLDDENVVLLGGDTGLRGYPLRYQNGESRVLFSVEQRYFSDWYPFRLFRVGGAVFADVGRVWGDSAVGEPDQGWLKDVGFGLRFASTRTGFRKIVHLDVAFPLDGDNSIDDVQILLGSKRRF